MTPEVQALARWCWPEAFTGKGGEKAHYKMDLAIGKNCSRDWPTVLACEQALVKRGLGKEYGTALAAQVGHPCSGPWPLKPHEALALATAPLDARVRAMTLVIGSLTP